MPKINVQELYANAEIKEPQRDAKGFHTLQFKDEKIKIKTKDGKEITLTASEDGWKELETMFRTKSPSVMAKRLIALAYNINHSQ
jgi:hypothetical protein